MTLYVLQFKATSSLQIPHWEIAVLLRHILVATWTEQKSLVDPEQFCVKHVFADLNSLFLPEEIPPTVTDTLVYDYGYYIYEMSMKRCISLLSV